MNIHHILASINVETGGPAVSVTRLHRSLLQAGVHSRIHCLDYRNHGPLADPDAGPFPVAGGLTRLTRGWNPELKRRLAIETETKPGVIHNHGCWMAPNLFARQSALRSRSPLLTSPRGMLEPWALRYRSFKKKAAWHLFEEKNLLTASAFHATSQNEAEAIRSLGFTQPIYLVPNGVDFPPSDTGLPLSHWIPNLKKPFFLFLSRLHPKKGIDLLISSWLKLEKQFPEWSLVIAGPDLDEYKLKLSEKFPLAFNTKSVIWTGPVEGAFKTALLSEAGFLALPSHSENFGHVVAEALAHQTPVLTTDQTPWIELPRRGSGWITSPDSTQLEEALESALQTPVSTLNAMGLQGSAWMRAEYGWDRISDFMVKAYNHLLGNREQIDFLIEK